MYSLHNDYLSTERKIETLVCQYIIKTGRIPDTVEMNPSQVGNLSTLEVIASMIRQTVEVRIVPSKVVMKNHYWIGVESDE